MYIFIRFYFRLIFLFVYSFYSFSFQGITHISSSGVVGDISVLTSVNPRDNTVSTEN